MYRLNGASKALPGDLREVSRSVVVRSDVLDIGEIRDQTKVPLPNEGEILRGELSSEHFCFALWVPQSQDCTHGSHELLGWGPGGLVG